MGTHLYRFSTNFGQPYLRNANYFYRYQVETTPHQTETEFEEEDL